MIHWPWSFVPQTFLSCWKPEPLASVDGWIRHPTGGESSWTVPLSTKMASACSRTSLVAKGHTGALFLLSELVEEALSKDLPDMKVLVVKG